MLKTTVRRSTVVALAGLVLGALAACGSDSEGPNTNPSLVPGATSGGKLTIGIPFDEPGIGLKSGDTYSGFDVDTARYVAGALGVPPEKITFVQAAGDDRQRLLASGEADLIVSTFSITDERKEQVDFAGPYFEAHQDLLVRRNNEEIFGPETLEDHVLCSVAGTTSAANVRERYKGDIELRELPTYSDCVTALNDSKVDAVTTDDVILAGYAAEKRYRGVLRLIGKGFSDEVYGIGIKKGDTDLVTKVNAALKEYIADGSWKRSLDRNVRPSGYDIPDPPEVGTA